MNEVRCENVSLLPDEHHRHGILGAYNAIFYNNSTISIYILLDTISHVSYSYTCLPFFIRGGNAHVFLIDSSSTSQRMAAARSKYLILRSSNA